MIDVLLKQRLQKRTQENALRSMLVLDGLIDFTSNDYLGLARSEELFNQIQSKVKSLPHKNGATGSRLLSGNNEYTEAVESSLAKIFKSESALIFNSGYAANQAVLSSLAQKGDTILYDELAHACMRDGARLSLAERFSFRHNDLNDLEEKLKKAKGNIFIAVESIYSMDGDLCPLLDLVKLSEKYSAHIILDEAHSTGIIGNNGAGLAVSLDVETNIAVRIYTFGKAMGVHGACVTGSKNLTNYLINFGRTFIFSTALPLHSIASIDQSFQHLSKNLFLQQELISRINTFNEEAEKSGLNKLKSTTQIQGVVIKGNENVKSKSSLLKSLKIDARPILSPTVPKGFERLRICLHTYNTSDEIKLLIQTLSKF